VILRVAAAVSLALGVTILLAYFSWIGEGPSSNPAERHLRRMKERADAPREVTPITFAEMESLPHARPLAEYAPFERRGVSLEGYVNAMHLSSDGDYHMSVFQRPPAYGERMGLTAELTPEWQRGSRGWRWEPLETALRPTWSSHGRWPSDPPRVRISGWLLYDFQYDSPWTEDKRLRLQPPIRQRLTGWEIHPVTRIEIWDDARRDFVEFAR
jgi:hypothetical protein